MMGFITGLLPVLCRALEGGTVFLEECLSVIALPYSCCAGIGCFDGSCEGSTCPKLVLIMCITQRGCSTILGVDSSASILQVIHWYV